MYVYTGVEFIFTNCMCIMCLLKVSAPDGGDIRTLRGHQLPVTCNALTPDDRFAFSADKDGCIIKCTLLCVLFVLSYV